MNRWKMFTNGIIKENPVFVLMLGLCPVLGTTTSALNGLGMGLATALVLVLANTMISAFKNFIPAAVRLPLFVVIIASSVTIIDLMMLAYMPTLHSQLGIFIPLIVVNCVVFARAEAFAFRNSVVDSTVDGLGMGLGFALALTVIGIIREFLGDLSFWGHKLIDGEGMLVFVLAPGGFFVLGILLVIINTVKSRKKETVKLV